ncbi:hypothetical protein [Hyphomicrobium sulfonivorans]|uniref:hypothetical protein n=1 Tax=Hyphomicrobium sulfonivorans TaxID=121290 RepID=UPI000837B681|nr:hypothetical protein [Hyphomicrobium sulfonivorans]
MTPLQQSSVSLADYVRDHIHQLPADVQWQASLLCGQVYLEAAAENIAAVKQLVPQRTESNVIAWPIIARPIPEARR